MKHNLIADIVKPWWFLKIVFSSKTICVILRTNCKQNKVRHHHVQIVCMSYFWKMILFTGLLCDNSNSLTYKPRKGKVQFFLVETMWPGEEWTSSHNALRFKLVYQHFRDCKSHADWLFTVTIVTWMYEDLFSFVIRASSEGSFLLRINNS